MYRFSLPKSITRKLELCTPVTWPSVHCLRWTIAGNREYEKMVPIMRYCYRVHSLVLSAATYRILDRDLSHPRILGLWLSYSRPQISCSRPRILAREYEIVNWPLLSTVHMRPHTRFHAVSWRRLYNVIWWYRLITDRDKGCNRTRWSNVRRTRLGNIPNYHIF